MCLTIRKNQLTISPCGIQFDSRQAQRTTIAETVK